MRVAIADVSLTMRETAATPSGHLVMLVTGAEQVAAEAMVSESAAFAALGLAQQLGGEFGAGAGGSGNKRRKRRIRPG